MISSYEISWPTIVHREIFPPQLRVIWKGCLEVGMLPCVAWETETSLKGVGGLGLKDILRVWNKAC